MKKLIIYSLVCLALFAACKKDKSSLVDDTTAEIRVLNATTWIFFDCTVDPTGVLSATGGSNAHNYGQVNINANSAYHTFPIAHRYSWVRLTMNSKTYLLQPIDYVGETPLTPGKYAYKLTYSATDDRLNLELIKE